MPNPFRGLERNPELIVNGGTLTLREVAAKRQQEEAEADTLLLINNAGYYEGES